MPDDAALDWHQAAVDAVLDAAVAAVNAGAEDIRDTSKRYTPKNTGTLAESTVVQPATRSNPTAEIRVTDPTDGGVKAVVVHEKTTLHHATGGAKFLERASTRPAEIGGVIAGRFQV